LFDIDPSKKETQRHQARKESANQQPEQLINHHIPSTSLPQIENSLDYWLGCQAPDDASPQAASTNIT
jgi:hypothetical protein